MPSGLADSATVDEDSSNNIIAVLNNDDIDLDGLESVNTGATSTQSGTLSVNANNEVVYTPVVQFVGQDTFTYTITDGNGDISSDITVTIDVIVVLPEPTDDAYVVNQDTSNHIFDVLLNDSFGADGPEGFTIATMPINGTLLLDDAGTIDPTDDVVVYTPTATYNGPDSFTYTLEDSNGDMATALVTIIVRPIVPVPVDDTATVDKNSNNNMISILANDDFGGNGPNAQHALSLSLVSDQGAVISIGDNGTPNDFTDDVIFYTPFPDFVGEDIITYLLTDADGDGNTGTLTVTVVEGNNGNYIPLAVADIATVFVESQDNVIFVLDNDTSGIDGYIDNGLTMLNGTLTSISLKEGIVNIDNKGTASTLDDELHYTPKAGFIGEDILYYTITDATGDGSTATVTITVTALTDTPTAVDDRAVVNQDMSVSIAVLDNDTFGTDGAAVINSLTVTGVSTEAGTTAVVNNQVVYTPAASFVGTDSFVYTITDASGADTSTATVTVTVNVVVDTPTANDDTATVNQDMSVSIAVLDNDDFGTDGAASSGSLTVTGSSVEAGAIIVVNNEVVYTPAAGFVGTDTFVYTITDGSADVATGMVTVTVTTVTSLPVPTAEFDFVSVNTGSSQNRIAVLDNDTFGSNGANINGLTMPNGLTSGISVRGASISIDNNGTDNTLDDVIIYSPPVDFIGIDIFDYTITDATGNAATATVTVTVSIATDIPTAVDDTAVVDQDISVSVAVLNNDSFGTDGAANTGSLTVTGVTVQAGSTSVENNEVVYTPAASFTGVDSFTYTITDTSGDTSTATVTVTVNVVVTTNGTPTANNDVATVAQDSADNVISILLDTGAGADSFGTDGPNATHPISLSGTYTDLGGKLELDGNTVKYTPEAGFSGVDSFNYTITDASGDADTATVTITVVATPAVLTSTTTTTANVLDNEFLVYPNPSNGYVKSTVFSTVDTKATLFIFDVTGKIIYNLPLQINKGANVFDFNLKVKPGVLFIKITSPEVNFGTSKIIFK